MRSALHLLVLAFLVLASVDAAADDDVLPAMRESPRFIAAVLLDVRPGTYQVYETNVYVPDDLKTIGERFAVKIQKPQPHDDWAPSTHVCSLSKEKAWRGCVRVNWYRNPARLGVDFALFALFKDRGAGPVETTQLPSQEESEFVVIDVVVQADDLGRQATKLIVNGVESKVFPFLTDRLEFTCSSAVCSIYRFPLPQ